MQTGQCADLFVSFVHMVDMAIAKELIGAGIKSAAALI